MELSELLQHLVGVCDGLGVPYFITGSQASITFGEPRFTNDIDVVAALRMRDAARFCAAFPDPPFAVDLEAVRRAIDLRGQFNILVPDSGLKIDVMLPKDSDFDEARFERVVVELQGEGVPIRFASPEDVILMKMCFYQEGGSEKHLRDITGILRLQREHLDWDLIDLWARRLGVTEVWQAVRRRVEAHWAEHGTE